MMSTWMSGSLAKAASGSLKTLLMGSALALAVACSSEPAAPAGEATVSEQPAESEAHAPITGVELVGISVSEPGYHVWGGSPVISREDGRTHLFVARWPTESSQTGLPATTPGDGFNHWFVDCEIAQYSADSPEGPFTFERVVVQDQDGVFNSPHNPTIHYVDGKYALFFIVNEFDVTAKQRIVMLTAETLDGPWVPHPDAEEDGTILRQTTDPDIWSIISDRGVTNPSFLKDPNPETEKPYLLFFKIRRGDNGRFDYGVARADNLAGPYAFDKAPLTENAHIEDGYAFLENGDVYLIVTDYEGRHERGGGLLYRSPDIVDVDFATEGPTPLFNPLADYAPEALDATAWRHKELPKGGLERPQALVIDGRAEYIYMAGTKNIASVADGTANYLFKTVRAAGEDTSAPD